MDFDLYLQRTPLPSFQKTSVVTFLKTTPFIWVLIVLISMMFTAKIIAEEKENGIKVKICLIFCDKV